MRQEKFHVPILRHAVIDCIYAHVHPMQCCHTDQSYNKVESLRISLGKIMKGISGCQQNAFGIFTVLNGNGRVESRRLSSESIPISKNE